MPKTQAEETPVEPAESLATLPARKRVQVVARANVVNGLHHLAAFERYELDDTEETRSQIAAGLIEEAAAE